MKKITAILYFLMLAVLAGATFFEHAWGSFAAHEYIYGSLWFVALWTALVVLSLAAVIGKCMWKQIPLFLIHSSLFMVFLGAVITFVSGKQGSLHLREGETANSFVLGDSQEIIDFSSFSLSLDSFRVIYYPETEAASDYVSYVTIEYDNWHDVAVISMNNILKVNKFRFYQASFDSDSKGVLLSANCDTWGITVTYAGYLLLGISVLLLLFVRRGTFRKLLTHPLLQKMAIVLLLIGSSEIVNAQHDLPVLDKEMADSLSTVQIVYQDRIAPFNTMAREVLLKVYGKTSYKGLTAEQVVGSLIYYPGTWQHEPLIYIKDNALCRELGLSGHYAGIIDLYENGDYKLEPYARTSARQGAFGKAVTQTEEKAVLLLMLARGTLFQPLNNDSQALSERKVNAEILYNKMNINSLLFKANLTVGLLAFFMFVLGIMHNRTYSWIRVLARLQLILSFVLLTVALSLRWYVSGHVPVANGYEAMMFAAWCTLPITFLLGRKSNFIPVAGLLLSGFMLLVSSIGSSNPQITSLMPVLMSPWLSAHVSFIMISYVLFGFMAINGIAALVLHVAYPSSQLYEEKLYVISRMLLYPAVGFLGIGITLGAVWANISWGRYWGWDPKEVWALITFMVYAIGFHDKSLKWLQQPVTFHVFSILAILTVLMTYFGVNFFFGGMHGYA